MPEMGTSGLMSGDGKRGGRSASVLAPILDSTMEGRSQERRPTLWRFEDLWQSHRGRQPRVKLRVCPGLRPPQISV